MAPFRDVRLPASRVQFLKERGHLFYADLKGRAELSPLEQLALKVMEHGGVAFICPGAEPDLIILMARGEPFPGDELQRVKGQPCRCHSNSAWYWSDHSKKVQIVTGYGLSGDGIWRQHTWCRKLKGGRIVETTEPREVYFGVPLTPEECETFFWDQAG